jgi:Tol biopolymer transport system component
MATAMTVMDPQPSPDGAQILFVNANYAEATGDIFLMDRNGANVVQLTTAPQLDDQPAWSPDGLRVAFRSYRAGREGDIWVMNAAGGNLTNLTPDPLPGISDERTPAWSPDGRRIAFASNQGGNMDIWTMAADGSDQLQLTVAPEFETEPVWSPDGATIAFRRNHGADSDLYLVASTGGPATRLTLPGFQRAATWSPDGLRLVFVNQPTLQDRPDLFSVAKDGTDMRAIVTDAVPGGRSVRS